MKTTVLAIVFSVGLTCSALATEKTETNKALTEKTPMKKSVTTETKATAKKADSSSSKKTETIFLTGSLLPVKTDSNKPLVTANPVTVIDGATLSRCGSGTLAGALRHIGSY
ncbi:MAG TPA: hypothetical protein VKC60_06940 [Opitutaceae bacterium]|nr:hypothetical protein [Opitutaceae bacterium]